MADTQTALNLVWTMVAAFLVMFMQAGFALVETGLTRAKNVAHTMGMNFFVYAIGIIGFYFVGFGLQMGGVGALATLGGDASLNHEFVLRLFGKDFGLFGLKGFMLPLSMYTPAIAAMFMFQMVFMDTTCTIPTGAAAERWKFTSFVIFSFVIATVIYPIYANWVWGGGWLSQLGANFGLGHGHVDFAGSSVVHLTGGVMALVLGKMIGPRIGKFGPKGGTPRPIPAHNIAAGDDRHVHPRVRLVRLQRRLDARRHGRPARRRGGQHDARLRHRRVRRVPLYAGTSSASPTRPGSPTACWPAWSPSPPPAPSSPPGRRCSSAPSPASSSIVAALFIERVLEDRRSGRRLGGPRRQRRLGHPRHRPASPTAPTGRGSTASPAASAAPSTATGASSAPRSSAILANIAWVAPVAALAFFVIGKLVGNRPQRRGRGERPRHPRDGRPRLRRRGAGHWRRKAVDARVVAVPLTG